MQPTNGESESLQVLLAFDSTVLPADRQHLMAGLGSYGLSTRRRLDFGYRSSGQDTINLVTVAVLTMLSTGFVQRFGEQAADQVTKVFTAVRDWLRRPRPAPVQVEIIDESTGLTFRVTAEDPDVAGRLMADAIYAVTQIHEHQPPQLWRGDRWAPNSEQPARVELRPRSDDGRT